MWSDWKATEVDWKNLLTLLDCVLVPMTVHSFDKWEINATDASYRHLYLTVPFTKTRQILILTLIFQIQ